MSRRSTLVYSSCPHDTAIALEGGKEEAGVPLSDERMYMAPTQPPDVWCLEMMRMDSRDDMIYDDMQIHITNQLSVHRCPMLIYFFPTHSWRPDSETTLSTTSP